MAQIAITDETTEDLAGPLPGRSAFEIIKVEGLEKRYPGRPVNAVDGITFAVPRGEVFGLLGPNGAGKTTTIGVLTTRVLPTGGRAQVAGIDVVRDPVGLKPHIAVVPQRNNLDRALSPLENLTFHAAYFGMSRSKRHEKAMRLLKEFGLAERANDKVAAYSGGMAQRLLIARALMHEPQVLFLDEPTTGLDPQARHFLWDTIRSFNRGGLTILLTTHDMEEAETLCHRVAIMDHGKILALDTPERLATLVPVGSRVELTIAGEGGKPPSEEHKALLLASVRALPGVTSAEWTTVPSKTNTGAGAAGPPGAGPGFNPAWAAAKSKIPVGPAASAAVEESVMLRLYAERAGELAVRAAQLVLEEGLELADLHLAKPSLEDVFIHLTGKGLRD
jgi:ABC-2 type transport system ATP-binding protein